MFRADGSLERVERPEVQPQRHGLAVDLIAAGGSHFVVMEDKPNTLGHPNEGMLTLWRVESGGLVNPTPWLLEGGTYLVARDQRNTMAIPSPLGGLPRYATTTDQTLVVGNTRSLELVEYAGPGEVVRRYELPIDGTPFSEDLRALFVEERQLAFDSELNRQRQAPDVRRFLIRKFDGLLDQVEFPETAPYYETFVLSEDEQSILFLLPNAGLRDTRRRWLLVDRTTQAVRMSFVTQNIGSVRDFAYSEEGLFTLEYDWEDDQIRSLSLYRVN